MPIIIPDQLPANQELKSENVFVMNQFRAIHQDIRALEVLILNLMPTKKATEVQLLRLLSNTPLQVNVTLLTTDSYQSKNISAVHLDQFYKTFDEIKEQKFDGMIITGAPVETLAFESVKYWEELKEIMDYSQQNVTSVFHICWGAQASLYHHYGIDKNPLERKVFGVYSYKINNQLDTLLKGFDDHFYAPHSRHTENRLEALQQHEAIEILSSSSEAGYLLAKSRDNKNIFVSGHLEYSNDTLHKEYMRDVDKGLAIEHPKNYYIDDTVEKGINNQWRSHAHLLMMNWLNYYVYQQTPYKLSTIGG